MANFINSATLQKYLLNCLLLIIPALAFNVIFTRQLPPAYQADVFWKDIPGWLGTCENLLRSLVFILPVLMPLNVTTREQRVGVGLFFLGTLIYFLAWIVLILYPASAWSTSAFGFMAPAYTPLLWLVGIGLIGDKLFVDVPYKPWIYIGLVIIFLCFHNTHASIVYSRNYP
jgi:hypothetical protein